MLDPKSFEKLVGFDTDSMLSGLDRKSALFLRNALGTIEDTGNNDFYVIDLKCRDIVFMSRNLSAFLNISASQSTSSLMEQFVHCIPVQDLEVYKSVLAVMPAIYNGLTKPERNSLMLSGNYHLACGRWTALVFERAMPLYVEGDGSLRMVLCTITGAYSREAGKMLITKGRGKATQFYSLDDEKWYPLRMAQLTAREHMILNFSARGFTSSEIAEQMNVSLDTIKNWRKNLLKKLDVVHITQAVKKTYNLRLT